MEIWVLGYRRPHIVVGENVYELRETCLEEKVGEHVSPSSLPQSHLPWRWCKAKQGETLGPLKHSCRSTVFPLLKRTKKVLTFGIKTSLRRAPISLAICPNRCGYPANSLAIGPASAIGDRGWAATTSLGSARSAMPVIHNRSHTPRCCFAPSRTRPPAVVSRCSSFCSRTWALVGNGFNDLCAVHRPKGKAQRG